MLTVDELLAEPPEDTSPHWLSATYARLGWAARQTPLPRLGDDALSERVRRAVSTADHRVLDSLSDVGQGSPLAGLVLIGERPARGQPPFLSRSGHWLFRSLRWLGWDELLLWVGNALRPDLRRHNDRLIAVHQQMSGAIWIALGETAQTILGACGIRHVAAMHPQAHTRFHRSEGLDGYRARLEAAGVPRGPYWGQALPVAVHLDARTAIADRMGMPADVCYRSGRSSSADERHVSRAKTDRARTLFVSGECDTIAAAARAVGCSAHDLRAEARRGRWDEARQQQRERETAEAYKRAAAEVGKAVATSLRLAWAGTTQALGSVVRRLQSGELVATPADVAHLARVACLLDDRRDPSADEARAALALIDDASLRREVLEARDAIFGKEKTPCEKP